METNKCNTVYKQTSGQRSYDFSTGAEKAFDKMKCLFRIKVLEKIGIEGAFISTGKDTYIHTYIHKYPGL